MADAHLDKINTQILDLPKPGQIAFAAWCCEQQFPYYQSFCEVDSSGDAMIFRDLLDDLWQWLLTGEVERKSVDEALSKCEHLRLDADDASLPSRQSINAVGSLSSALSAMRDFSIVDVMHCAANMMECAYNDAMPEFPAILYPGDVKRLYEALDLDARVMASKIDQLRAITILSQSPFDLSRISELRRFRGRPEAGLK